LHATATVVFYRRDIAEARRSNDLKIFLRYEPDTLRILDQQEIGERSGPGSGNRKPFKSLEALVQRRID
jgi:hypothetical protein